MQHEVNMLLNNFNETDLSNGILNCNFTVNELLKTVKQLKINKSPGGDGIINEIIIHRFNKLSILV